MYMSEALQEVDNIVVSCYSTGASVVPKHEWYADRPVTETPSPSPTTSEPTPTPTPSSTPTPSTVLPTSSDPGNESTVFF